MSIFAKYDKPWKNWTRRYLLVVGVGLIGVPLWEFFLETFADKEVDLFFPGNSDVYIGAAHIAILALFHFIAKKIE